MTGVSLEQIEQWQAPLFALLDDFTESDGLPDDVERPDVSDASHPRGQGSVDHSTR